MKLVKEFLRKSHILWIECSIRILYSYIESVVTSASAKALAQPTLLVQEGEKASVRSGESVITGVEREVSGEFVQFSNTREDAGLTLNLEVEKVDDNGFVDAIRAYNFTPSVCWPAEWCADF